MKKIYKKPVVITCMISLHGILAGSDPSEIKEGKASFDNDESHAITTEESIW